MRLPRSRQLNHSCITGLGKSAQGGVTAIGAFDDFAGDNPTGFVFLTASRKKQTRPLKGYFHISHGSAVEALGNHAIHFTKFAKGAALIATDPAVNIVRARMIKTGGFYTWTEEDAAKFEARHPTGSTARLALALYLNLGVRKSDVVRIGPRHIRDGILHNFLPQKTSRNGGKRISITLFEETKAVIAATPVTGTQTYLQCAVSAGPLSDHRSKERLGRSGAVDAPPGRQPLQHANSARNRGHWPSRAASRPHSRAARCARKALPCTIVSRPTGETWSMASRGSTRSVRTAGVSRCWKSLAN